MSDRKKEKTKTDKKQKNNVFDKVQRLPVNVGESFTVLFS
jgi:hypothetical protein